jgi:hypothetical protein
MEFCDGFDNHNPVPGKWGSATGGFGSIAVNATAGRDGRGAAVTNKAYAIWTGPAVAGRSVGFALTGSGGNNANVAQLMKSNNVVGALQWNSGGTFSIVRGSDNTVLGSSTAALPANTWGYLEFKYKASASITSGDVVACLNGVTIITIAGGTRTASSPNLTIDTVAVGSISGALNAFDATIDDVVILDLSETLWGDVIVEGRMSDGDGFYSQFTPIGATPNYACVDEVAIDGDTTYVDASNLHNRDTYVFPDALQAVQLVKAVQIGITAKRVGADLITLTPSIRISSTDYDQTPIDLTTSYVTYLEQFTTNPATSVAWTESDTAALEAGMQMTF